MLEPFNSVLMEAAVIQMSFLHARMVALFSMGLASFLCCCYMAKFFLLGVAAGLVCTAAVVRLGDWREKDASIHRGGSFDLFLLAQACRTGW